LVNLAKAGNGLGAGAAGTMDDMGDANQGVLETIRVGDRAHADVDERQVGLDEAFVAGRPEQDGSRQIMCSETVENMAAHEPASPCEKDFH
jgi:hypothetical protein